MPESLNSYETIQPTLEMEIEYPRRSARSIGEIDVYRDAETVIDLHDTQQLGHEILANEQFWLGHEL